MSDEGNELEQALRRAQQEAEGIAAQAARLREERLDEEGVRARVREMSEAMDEMRARFVQQLEEFLPAAPIEATYERLGTQPASEEQLEEFLAGHDVPVEGR